MFFFRLIYECNSKIILHRHTHVWKYDLSSISKNVFLYVLTAVVAFYQSTFLFEISDGEIHVLLFFKLYEIKIIFSFTFSSRYTTIFELVCLIIN